MYARTTYPPTEELHIPTNYAGTALRDTVSDATEASEEYIDSAAQDTAAPPKEETCIATARGHETKRRESIPFLSRLLGGKGFSLSSILDALRLSPLLEKRGLSHRGDSDAPFLGTEEIWLLLLAAFLFFSDSGDKTCALILVAVLLLA